jgi:hypothetical protein
MNRRLFTDQDVNPTDTLLRKQLGTAIAYYTAILETSGDFRKQWQFSNGNGWLLKVHDTRKALYYLIVIEDGIVITLTVRDSERETFLNNEDLKDLRTELESATKYSEGYALRFEIKSEEKCRLVAKFLIALIKERMSKQVSAQKATRPGARRVTK